MEEAGTAQNRAPGSRGSRGRSWDGEGVGGCWEGLGWAGAGEAATDQKQLLIQRHPETLQAFAKSHEREVFR